MKPGTTNWRSMDRVGTARGPMDRHELARSAIDRDGFGRGPRDGGGWGSLDRDRIGRDLLDRDRIGRDLLDRDRIGRDLLDRDRIGRDLLDRDRIGRDLVDRDRIGRDLVDRDRIGRDLVDRDRIGRDLVDRDRIGRDLLGRDRIGQDLVQRGRIGRDLLERDGIGRDHLERDRIGRGAIGLDRTSRDTVDRERIGHDARDGVGRFLLDRDRMSHSLLDRDGSSRGPPDREAIKWNPLDRENMGRVSVGMGELHTPMNREEIALDRPAGRAPSPIDGNQLTWSSMDRGRITRSPVGRERSPVGRERSPVGRERSPIVRDETWGRMAGGTMGREGIVPGFMDRGEPGPMSRDDISRGLLARGVMTGGSMGREGIERDDFARGSVDHDGVGKSFGDQGGIAKGPVDPDNNKDLTLGNMDQDEKTQSDMEPCDMEQSDMEMSDTDQSEVNHGEVKDETQDQDNNENQGQANVTGAEGDQENAKKSDNPEDKKNEFYCEICRLTCLSSMSYQSHIRGAKHLKNTTTLQVTGFRGAHKYRKIKKTGKSLKDYMDEPLREPLIGLEHVVEYSVPGKAEPCYHCELCGFKTELAPMIEHLNGFRHRRAYISKEFPFLLKAPPGQKEDKVQFLRRMAADIERDEGLKMYRADLLSAKKKIKSLLEITPDEIPIQRNTSDNPVSDNETLKTKALQSLETYEIESDAEAVLLMTITQELSEILKAYCLKVKEETAHAEKVARARSGAEPLSQTNPAIPPLLEHPFGPPGKWNLLPGQQAPNNAGNRNWPNNPIQQNQPAQNPAGGPNWNQGIMQNQPALDPGNWDRGPMMQVRQGLKPTAGYAQPAPLGRPDMFVSKGIGSERSQFAPKESCGPGSFSSGSSFGNEYGPTGRAPLLSSMPGAPPQLFMQTNPSAPATNKLLDVPRSDPLANRFMRGLPDQGTMHQPVAPGGFRSNVPANFNTGPKMLPSNINTDGRIGTVGYSQFMPPNSHLNARAPLGPVLPMASEMPEKKASPLTAEILSRIRGKDVKSATAILGSLVASNPALQKVNMTNLLNLLVETGTISG
ncbi:uncharacterized protein LOC144829022 [Lissotriton helveticus]